MKLKDNSTQEIDTALYQLEQRLKSNIRLTDVENSNASTAKINAVDKKLTEEVKDRQSADEKLQDNINKEIADRQEADAAIENAKQDKLIAGDNIQINGNIISATSKEYTAEAPVKVTDGIISLDTVPVNKGGTGVTTQSDINKAFVSNLDVGTSDVTDGTEFVSSYASDNGFASTDEGSLNTPYKRQFIKVWNYIKGKISSVLGLTKDNYGGTAATILDYVKGTPIKVRWEGDGINSAEWYPAFNADGSAIEPINRANIHAGTAGTAGSANKLNPFAYWGNPYDYDSTNGVRVYVYKITMVAWFSSILVQIYDDINYARSRKYFLGLWHVNNYGYNVSVTDLGGTKDSGLRVWLGNDGNVYLQADVYWTSRISFSYLDDVSDVTITKIGSARYGSNADINGNVLFTPLTDPIVDCGALRAASDLSSVSREPQLLKTDILFVSNKLEASSKMVIPIGEPSSLEDGCIWIER